MGVRAADDRASTSSSPSSGTTSGSSSTRPTGSGASRAGNIWWLPGPWILRFPIDYYVGLGVSCLLAAATWIEDGSPDRFYEHLGLILGCIVLTAIAIPFAPLYGRWYRHMRRPGTDDRPITPITPPPK